MSGDKQAMHHEAAVDPDLTTLEGLLTIDEKLRSQARKGRERVAGKEVPHVKGTGLEVENLTYTVMKKYQTDGKWSRRQVYLLHGISSFAAKGQVTAVLGPSGAGKSTFLDALAGRITSGSSKGCINVDGQPVDPSLMKRMSAYVMKEDQLFPMLTVWETLYFAAEMHLPQSMPSAEKGERVRMVINQLGLTNAQNSYVGKEGTRGISVGERRRVSIGVHIIHGPALLFLDEPTSGLDSTNAYTVMERVHDIATSGSTVILTTHQPSYRIQHLLHRLIVLARGKLRYHGSPSYLTTHLAALGREVPRGVNSIDYLLELIHDYDNSTLGSDSLQFQGTGAKTTPTTMLQPKTSSTANSMPRISSYSDSSQTKSSLDKNFAPVDDNSMDRMEASIIASEYAYNDDLDDAYDHSLTRDFPRLASFYYKGILTMPDRIIPLRTPVTERKSGASIIDGHNYADTSTIASASRTPVFTPSRMENICAEIVSESQSAHSPNESPAHQDMRELQDHKFANAWWREVLILTIRSYKNIQRTKELFISRLVLLAVTGFLMATLFRSPPNDLEGVSQVVSFFISSVCVLFFSIIDAVPTILEERLIVIRETSQNGYRSSSFVVANFVTSLPFLAVQAITYVLITFWAVRLDGGDSAFYFLWLVCFVCLIATNSFVMFISALVPDFTFSYTLVVAFISVFFLTCGYFLKRTAIPVYWRWLHYASMFKYPYEAMIINNFENGGCYEHVTDRTFNSSNVCVADGPSLLKDMDATQLSKWEALYVLIGFAVFYRVLFYSVLRSGSKTRRN